MKKFVSFMAVAAIATCLFAPQAQARPQYASALKKAYPDNAKVNVEKNCGVCHGKGGMNKKVVSDYGKALKEALELKPMQQERDAGKITAALKKISEAKEGEKTYEEILMAGELPKAAE